MQKDAAVLPTDARIARDIEAVKRLFVLALIKTGTTQEEIAMALQIDRSAVSRMFPARKVQPFSRGQT